MSGILFSFFIVSALLAFLMEVAILPSPFMCVYLPIIAAILAVTLWQVDSAAALKHKGYQLESSLVGHLDKGSVMWRCKFF